ncbi:hypothetical protein QAD02_001916 [Eretmocerus hayati]|uniref:Uncharacterized protein n=1 Tax=Eretmocerus hayati TaxID=131215 RepID=A0ACC2NHS4_9HYME|nr:hypothetical protein QAD02_001916 [Eretmocerus hayati]
MFLKVAKLYSHSLKSVFPRSYSLVSTSCKICQQKRIQMILITRSVMERPKELDQIRLRSKEREKDRYYQQKGDRKQSHHEEIGAYAIFLLSIPVITFGLGTWQVGRRQWKLELIKDLEQKLSSEPVEIPENLRDLVKMEYCPIKARGRFLYDEEFVMSPRSLIVDGKPASEGKGNMITKPGQSRGCYVITPFKLEDRDLVILVNRGWLPNKYKSAEARKNCRVEGVIEITGINRLHEARPQFVFKNEPEKGIWNYRDLYQMSEFAHSAPVFLDRIETDPGPNMPIGGQTRVSMRNEHLSYIITWYTLAAITGTYWYRMYILKKPIF